VEANTWRGKEFGKLGHETSDDGPLGWGDTSKLYVAGYEAATPRVSVYRDRGKTGMSFAPPG